MNKIVITGHGITSNNTSLGEVLLMLLYYNKIDIETVHNDLIKKGYVTSASGQLIPDYIYRVTNKGSEVVASVILDSDNIGKTEDAILSIAEKLKAIFPTGKKVGTSNYWAEGKALIVKRLKAFFKKYGNNFTEEEIVNAARKYVESFNGDYRFMRTLKYFIFKEECKAGEVESTSDLLSYIENAGHENNIRNDWEATLV